MLALAGNACPALWLCRTYFGSRQQRLVDGELYRTGCWPRAKIVHARLQTLSPAVKVHAR
jgi:hypothetical protein